VQRGRGGLAGQDVLGSLRGPGLGHRFLPPHGVDRDHGARKRHQPQEWGHGRDGVRLVLDFALASHPAMGLGPRAAQVDGALGGRMLTGAPECFAIPRDDRSITRLAQGLRPGPTALGQCIRFEP